MSITLTTTTAGRKAYCFNIQFIVTLAQMHTDMRADKIAEEARLWVSENEGYNSIEFDHLVEQLEDELSYQVETYIELEAIAWGTGQPSITWA